MKAIVIGGGIGGAAAAIALVRVGVEVAVYERAPEPGEVGAGLGLGSNAMRALERIGADAPVRAVSEPAGRAELRSWRGRVLARTDLNELDRRAGTLSAVVHRAELLGALLSCLPEGVVRFGHRFVGMEQDAGGVAARLDTGSGVVTDRGDVLIGADGINSAVREAIRGREPTRYSGYTCWRGVAEFPYERVPPGYVSESWGPGARFGITRIGRGRIYWWAAVNAPEGRSFPDAEGFLLERFGGWHEPIADLIRATGPGAIIHNDIADRPPRRGWTKGRVALLGDAAHATTPNLGQGGCMAIEDGAVLARRLAGAGDVKGALREYERERFARTASIVRASWGLGRWGQRENAAVRWARDLAIRAMPDWVMMRSILRFNAFDVGEVARASGP